MFGNVSANSLNTVMRILDTGVTEIDAIETAFAASMKLVFATGGTGDFTVGETVTGNGKSAVGLPSLSGDTIASVTITDGGEGYLSASPPAVTFSGGGGTGAAGTAVVNSSGLVTGVTITNAGSGYTSVPTITFAPSPSNTTAEVKSWDSATRTLRSSIEQEHSTLTRLSLVIHLVQYTPLRHITR